MQSLPLNFLHVFLLRRRWGSHSFYGGFIRPKFFFFLALFRRFRVHPLPPFVWSIAVFFSSGITCLVNLSVEFLQFLEHLFRLGVGDFTEGGDVFSLYSINEGSDFFHNLFLFFRLRNFDFFLDRFYIRFLSVACFGNGDRFRCSVFIAIF